MIKHKTTTVRLYLKKNVYEKLVDTVQKSSYTMSDIISKIVFDALMEYRLTKKIKRSEISISKNDIIEEYTLGVNTIMYEKLRDISNIAKMQIKELLRTIIETRIESILLNNLDSIYPLDKDWIDNIENALEEEII